MSARIEVLTLALSDVPSDRLDVIGSGPTTPDRETLKRISGKVRSTGLVIAGARLSLKAAAQVGRKRSYRVCDLGVLKGETRREAARQARLARKAVLISGGELTVEVRGKGRGGRNQEFVLAALCELARKRGPFFVLAAGTDGRDGATDCAGAWADRGTWERARKLGLDPRNFLARNDSHTFFKKAGGLIRTGPTGTNVMDFRLVQRSC